MNKADIKFVFFGTGSIGAHAFAELLRAGLTPSLVVTSPDRPAGRGRTLTPSAVKVAALERAIPTLEPEKLDELFLAELHEACDAIKPTCFAVVDYGKILPKRLLEMPPRGTLNMHPSLLPRLRGPSPIRSAILHDEKIVGVTVMLLDEELDHGPIVAQKKIAVPEWPPHGRDLDLILASEGGKLLTEILPLWARGEIEAREQNHDVATYSKFIRKEDGLLDLKDEPYRNLLKIRAFEGWPGTYTFFERGGKKIRVQVLDAHAESKKLVIDRVKPEGKNEMSYEDFMRTGAVLQ